jgi:hypothetical protein
VLTFGKFVMRRRREEWLRDIEERQRNIVFPDTVQNEGRFWRNLTTRTQRLTKAQIFGIALFYILLLGMVSNEAVRRFRFAGSGSVFDRLIAAFGGWAILFLLFGALFLVLRWRVRRALREFDSRNAHKRISSQ